MEIDLTFIHLIFAWVLGLVLMLLGGIEGRRRGFIGRLAVSAGTLLRRIDSDY
jgi:hypothetical protein